MTIQVDFNHLSAASDSLGQTAKQIEDHLHQLEQALKPLVQTWQGAAQEAYTAAQAEWDRAAKDMQEICAKMGLAVKTSLEHYQHGENANKNRFQ